jgi:hypothetical protein
MNYYRPGTLCICFYFLFSFTTINSDGWIKKKYASYSINYTKQDKQLINEYQKLISVSLDTVQNFFNASFQKEFEVFIHPNRKSWDSTWQRDWSMPGFKSECWMVASGVDKKIDIISPKVWGTESCEHTYSNKEQTLQLITHELVHVYHGQVNISPDFSDVENIDWFVEGLATYASGQYNSIRISEVMKAIANKTYPQSLDKFWTGTLKYGLSGSIVMFVDKKYGRTKLKELLKYNKKQQILDTLQTTEEDLLSGWREYMTSSFARHHNL